MKVSPNFHLPRPLPWADPPLQPSVRQAPASPGRHPCGDCVAPCCWFLLIEDDHLERAADLQEVSSYLNYERLVAWASPALSYALGIVTPCQHLDRITCGCRLHGRPEQPLTCRVYDAHQCWYRPLVERSRFWRLRLDATSWPVFCERILLDEEGVVAGVDFDPGCAADRQALASADSPRWAESATIAFDMPVDGVDTAEERVDLLHFFSNFAGCYIGRSPSGWSVLFRTRRAAGVQPAHFEVRDGRLDGFEPDECFFPSRDHVLQLLRQLGPDVFDLSPGELRRA